jgi:hypothetical protein
MKGLPSYHQISHLKNWYNKALRASSTCTCTYTSNLSPAFQQPSKRFFIVASSVRSISKSRPLSSPSSWPHYATRSKGKKKLSYEDVMNMDDGTLDPFTILNGTLSMPKALSPSAAAEFKNCPQSFLFQYLYSIKQPPNLALAKGSMCHSALEQIYDLEPKERTLEHLHNLFRKNWAEVRLSEMYGPMFEKSIDNTEAEDGLGPGEFETNERDIEAERKWGNEALELLNNYYQVEDPRLIPRPNPLERERWVTAHLTLDPKKGATAPVNMSNENESHNSNIDGGEGEEEETFYVRGIVDRLDYIAIPPSPHDNYENENPEMGAVRIVDYKTGKAPDFKYSPATNQRIAEDNMWQLKIYALLLREMIDKKKAYSKSGNLQKVTAADIRFMRLLYLTSVDGDARFLDMDLGKTQEERNVVLQQVHQELSDIWTNIRELVQMQDPRQFEHCDRKWCICHKIRPKFVSGSLYNTD